MSSTIEASKMYQETISVLRRFLTSFEESSFNGSLKYVEQLRCIFNRKTTLLKIHLDDILQYTQDQRLISSIENNAQRYVKIFQSLASDLLRTEIDTGDSEKNDSSDILAGSFTNTDRLPGAGHCPYEICLMPLSTATVSPLRALRAADIGKLVSVQGLVTRVSDVKPVVRLVHYLCERCGHKVQQDVSETEEFVPLTICSSDSCVAHGIHGTLFRQLRGCAFSKHQELRLQELQQQVPVGHIPRTISVNCHGESVRACTPGSLQRRPLVSDLSGGNVSILIALAGDLITVTGIFLPIQFRRHTNSDVLVETCVSAMSVMKDLEKVDDEVPCAERDAQLDAIVSSNSEAYTFVAQSIAPEIFGHEDVKKALLLQLVGGSSRYLSDGMRIRGDIHVCLVGDPGLAKSQLLRYMASATARGVYTTGKGSSGVGLTASVARDPVSSEVVLETGALVLADGGVCCIDEFDKMDEHDRTALHEVMEQQTVSVAKAGIITTLNSRCAVLAAANPKHGRYNPKLSISDNIDLPPSLASRFDLLFVLLDKPEVAADVALARHVAHVHRFLSNPKQDFQPCDLSFLRYFISQARNFEPYIPATLTTQISDNYVMRRQGTAEKENVPTARQLLSILRLSQALARLRFDDVVSESDVNEATRLSHMSQVALPVRLRIQSHVQATHHSKSSIVDPKSMAFNAHHQCPFY